ncbi:MAG: hypothetical protein MUC34_09765 [Anaerolineae bacterium]|jgi:hypothetical protein|nr:hypothetical protein [Anaerolineae bacterium]
MSLEKPLPVVALLVALVLAASVAGVVLTMRKRAGGFEASVPAPSG